MGVFLKVVSRVLTNGNSPWKLPIIAYFLSFNCRKKLFNSLSYGAIRCIFDKKLFNRKDSIVSQDAAYPTEIDIHNYPTSPCTIDLNGSLESLLHVLMLWQDSCSQCPIYNNVCSTLAVHLFPRPQYLNSANILPSTKRKPITILSSRYGTDSMKQREIW